jgi:hypothetical protein
VANKINYDNDLRVQAMIGAYDDNFDGKIQMDELKGGRAAALRTQLAAIDANKDGAVDLKEFSASPLGQARRRATSEEH